MSKVINFQSLKDGVWFTFFYSKLNTDTMDIGYGEPIEGGPQAQIRNPTPFWQERARSRKTETELVFNKKARKMEKVVSEKELTPEEKKKETGDFIDFLIQDLRGFKLDGKAIKATREDKIAAMEIPLFSMFINRCVELLQGMSATEEDAENLKIGSSSKTAKLDPE